MKPANINFLMQDKIHKYVSLLKTEPQTKEEFINSIKENFSINKVENNLFYQSVLKSDFDTIRINHTKDAVLFNQ